MGTGIEKVMNGEEGKGMGFKGGTKDGSVFFVIGR
jgi:hypothetical protein